MLICEVFNLKIIAKPFSELITDNKLHELVKSSTLGYISVKHSMQLTSFVKLFKWFPKKKDSVIFSYHNATILFTTSNSSVRKQNTAYAMDFHHSVHLCP